MDRTVQDNDFKLGLTTNRLETLVDSIFAFSMTLLALNLHIPEATKMISGEMLHKILLRQAHKFWFYILSFILLALFWIIHHQDFHFIKRTNRTHIWINIFILIFVVVVPFSTSLVGDYKSDWMSHFFFAANIFIISLLFSLHWFYATGNHRLVDTQIDSRQIVSGRRRGLVTSVVSLLAVILSIVYTPSSLFIFLLIPILVYLPRFKR